MVLKDLHDRLQTVEDRLRDGEDPDELQDELTEIEARIDTYERVVELQDRVEAFDEIAYADADIVEAGTSKIVETGTSKTQRDLIRILKDIIPHSDTDDDPLPEQEAVERAVDAGIDAGKAENEIDWMVKKGVVYHNGDGLLRT